MPAAYQGLGYHELNAMLNLYGPNGEIQFEADREAAHQYFLQHVNNNTVFFHDLEEKLDYLVKNEYYERETLDQYTMNFIRELYNRAYKKKFRFETFLGAFKFYTSYTLKTFDGKRFLERYEDRVCMVALHLARGDEQLATQMVDEIIEGRFQPATPTFLNAGKKQRGELVSCFLLRIEDNMESIGRSINSALQLTVMRSSMAGRRPTAFDHEALAKPLADLVGGLHRLEFVIIAWSNGRSSTIGNATCKGDDKLKTMRDPNGGPCRNRQRQVGAISTKLQAGTEVLPREYSSNSHEERTSMTAGVRYQQKDEEYQDTGGSRSTWRTHSLGVKSG